MAYSVIEKRQVMAKDIDSLNRYGAYASAAVEAGMTFRLDTLSTTRNENEVWVATAPATGSLNGVWMVDSQTVNISTVGTLDYSGLNDDPQLFLIPQGDVFTAFKPQPDDIIVMTADAFTGAKSTNTHGNTADGQVQLVWGSSQTADALSFIYLETVYIAIGNPASPSNRVSAYKMKCLAN